jgi:hypothetical protein
MSPAFALDASDFSDLEGWTVAAVTTVRGDFEGCDFDKRIPFDNGWVLTCSEYSYSYAYRPDAVIFAKSVDLRGRAYWMVKVLIEDEFYEMQPVPVKVSRPRTP